MGDRKLKRNANRLINFIISFSLLYYYYYYCNRDFTMKYGSYITNQLFVQIDGGKNKKIKYLYVRVLILKLKFIFI